MNQWNIPKKHRVLIITRNLPPLIGGMERLNWHIVEEFSKTNEVRVIGPKGSVKNLPHGVLGTDVPLNPLPLFLARATIAALKDSISFKPDLVFAGSGLTAPIAWLASSACNAHCAVYLHGLDIDTNNLVYRKAWIPFIRRCSTILVNSIFTNRLALNAEIPADKTKILNPGVELPDIEKATTEGKRFRKRYSLNDAPLMLYVGRVTRRKGLLAFVCDVFPTIVEKDSNVKLVVIGNEPKESILGPQGEMERVNNALRRHGLINHVIFLDEMDFEDPRLSAAYFAADVLIFPVQEKKHDNEGFGMVAIEAAAHGLPTVAYSAGGVADAVCDPASGKLIPAEDADAFIKALIYILYEANKDDYKSTCRTFAEGFAWPLFGEQLREYIQLNC